MRIPAAELNPELRSDLDSLLVFTAFFAMRFIFTFFAMSSKRTVAPGCQACPRNVTDVSGTLRLGCLRSAQSPP